MPSATPNRHADDRLTRDLLAPLLAWRPPLIRFVPILGWMIRDARWSAVGRPIAAGISATLETRVPTPIEAWGDDPAVRRIVATVLSEIEASLGWRGDRLRPDDDATVALWDSRDDLLLAQLAVDLERALRISITDDEIVAMAQGEIGAGSLGEAVAWLARRVPG